MAHAILAWICCHLKCYLDSEIKGLFAALGYNWCSVLASYFSEFVSLEETCRQFSSKLNSRKTFLS